MRIHHPSILLPAALLLSACGGGGGGGGGGGSAPAPTPMFAVGGTSTGIAGDGLTLRLNGAQSVALDGNGAFNFSSPLPTGAAYTVTIETQPTNPSQTCVLANASGSVGGAPVTNVSVTCSTNTYSVGGAVSGLGGTGLVLQINGASDLAVTGDGDFVFDSEVESGEAFAVTVLSPPANPSQTCVVARGAGEIGAADITDLAVECTTNSYWIRGNVSGLAGTGLRLALNGGENVAPVANGAFQFGTMIESGGDYTIALVDQPQNPTQTCEISAPTGTVGGSDVNVSVTCETNTYMVGGTVSGLTGTGLVLQLNGNDDLPVNADGAFVFPAPVTSGNAYSVTVKDQTSTFREQCVVSNANGTVLGSTITDVAIDCAVVLGYVYVAEGADGVLRTYGIREGGSLLRLPSTASIGTSPREMIVAPDGRTLYATNYSTNSVNALTVDPDRGALTPLGVASMGAQASGAMDLAIAPSGEFLYATNSVARTVTRFSVDTVTGALTNEGVAAMAAGNTVPARIAITPDGAHLYMLAKDNATTQSVTVYAIDPVTGALTAGASIDPGTQVEHMEMDAMGRTLYVSRVQMPVLDQYETTLQPYEIDPGTGALTAVGSGTLVIGQGQDLALDPTGNYAYVTVASGYPFTPTQRIKGLTIDQASGALFEIGGYSEFYATPYRLAFHSTGRFMFVGNYSPLLGQSSATWYDVLSYEIGAPAVLPGQLWPGGTGTSSVGFPAGNLLSVIAVVD